MPRYAKMANKSFKFEAALIELEDITKWFEAGDVDLDASVAKFERGMQLATDLKTHLAQVQNRIETVRVSFATGATGAAAIISDDPIHRATDDLLD